MRIALFFNIFFRRGRMDPDKSPLLQRPDYLVCTCMGVMHSEIVAAIKDGATTVEELSDRLLVGTGCNSCVPEVEEMLAKNRTCRE